MHDHAARGLRRRCLGKPAFMEVLSAALLTNFVLNVIQSSIGETCDGMVEQVRCCCLAHSKAQYPP